MESNKTHKDFDILEHDYLTWRSPRFGSSNPERMDNKVWKWLIHSRINAYRANKEMNGPDPFENGPGWCFDRFGQTSTLLPDGRAIYIAGEHEDSYDPDFNIYNDVIVVNPDKSIEIYGYPCDSFIPTDFHSSTLVGNKIVFIGNLGYLENRKDGATQVYALDTESYKIEHISTSGDNPGWIHSHEAELDPERQTIKIRGGKVDLGGASSLIENIDDWRLDLVSWTWERLTTKKWHRFEVMNNDKKMNNLWEMRNSLWNREVGWKNDFEESLVNLAKKIGITPDFNSIKKLYSPPVTHSELAQNEDEYGTYRILIDGTVVRYVEDAYGIQVTIEGSLSEITIELLEKDLLEKLESLENTSYKSYPIKAQ